ncbi:glucokinase [Marinobacter salinexigens]|uniref:Glucokinase n=1 Tax=Marinobacter salinexigens TaxID=2919747 RepID=A0A5B0VKC4_9GAMM|nr:glucokinase [Marinobacter salinexigens]KAA1174914.1 glucokinase [Marinobacter salinexigens]
MTEHQYALVGDIGGTNVRFALVKHGIPSFGRADDGRAMSGLESVESLPCTGYPDICAAIADYLGHVGVGSVVSACLAVAAPVYGTQVRLTNNPWQFDIEELRQRFGWERFEVINDFTAMALGVSVVPSDELIHVCGGIGDASAVRLVMGPGTGLGVSALVPVGNGWAPLETEGGHVDLPVTNDLDMEILKRLQARFGRVSVERVLCGDGLVNLYRALADISGIPAPLVSPEAITESAIEGTDALAVRTLHTFCEILGRTVGNSALTLGATGGVYLCGGILPNILDFFLKSRFRQGFEDKGRMRPIMERTPVFVVTDRFTGLRGAAVALGSAVGEVYE